MKIRVRGVPCPIAYTIEIRRGILDDAGNILARRGAHQRVVVLTDRTVHTLWYPRLRQSLIQNGLRVSPIILRNGERFKTLRTYEKVITRMAALRIDRHATLVTFGGGVVGDIGGSVAATYMRGIRLVHIPTTAVAQIDASIGGKTGLDHPRAKNLIGCFYNPATVLIDPDVLATLSEREFLNGLFEAIKVSLVCSPQLFAFIQRHVAKILSRHPRVTSQLVCRCVKEKVEVVTRDPFDHNRRAMLNFGHTLAHALETAHKYSRIGHGEAVGWGMLLALKISEIVGYMRLSAGEDIAALIRPLLHMSRVEHVAPR